MMMVTVKAIGDDDDDDNYDDGDGANRYDGKSDGICNYLSSEIFVIFIYFVMLVSLLKEIRQTCYCLLHKFEDK